MPHVFLSFASPDADAAREVARTLRAVGCEVWCHAERLPQAGEVWQPEIDEALTGSGAFVVLVGARGIDRWVAAEVGYAVKRNVLDPKYPVVPLLIDGAIADALPPFLGRHQAIDLGQHPWRSDHWPSLAERLGRLETARAVPADEVFKGLTHYEEADAAVWFGRDQETADLVRALDGGVVRWLAVEGPSGAGKSSIVRAGLVPALRRRAVRGVRGQWIVGVLRPGTQPLENLATAVSRALIEAGVNLGTAEVLRHFDDEPGEAPLRGLARLLRDKLPKDHVLALLVDQMEEALVGDIEPVELTRFDRLLAGLLLDTDVPAVLISTLRSDATERLALLPQLAGWLNRHAQVRRVFLRPMGRSAFETVLKATVATAGLRWEPGLLERLQDDIHDGAVPGGKEAEVEAAMVGHVLAQLAAAPEHGVLTLRRYQEDLGGVSGALARSADATLDVLGVHRADGLRLLVRLARPAGQGERPTLRVLSWADACVRAGGGDNGEAVVRGLSGARDGGAHGAVAGVMRLVTVGSEQGAGGRVSLVHESLVRAWPTLSEALEKAAEQERLFERLSQAAATWITQGRSPDFLPRGRDLLLLAEVEDPGEEGGRLLRAARGEEQRAVRMWRAGVFGLALATVVFAGLAVYAEGQSRLAEERLEKALEVAAFIAFTIETDLREVVGAAEVRLKLLDAAADLLDAAAPGTHTGGTIVSTATHGSRCGLELTHGDVGTAKAACDQAVEAAERAVRSAPGPNTSSDLSTTLYSSGHVAVTEGRLGDARVAFERSLAIREQMMAQDPGNTNWQRDVTASLDKVGDVAVAEGRLGDARLAFERSLAIREQMVAQDPGNTGWQRDVATSWTNIGGVAVEEGRLGDARVVFERSLAILEQMVAQDPGNTEWQWGVAVSLDKVGNVAVAEGRLGDARAAFERSLAILEQMVAQDPGNTEWQRGVAASLDWVGEVALAEGRLGDARMAFGRSLGILEQLVAQDPGNTGWQRDMTVSWAKVGDVAVAEGRLGDARLAFERSRASMEQLMAQDPGNTGWQRDVTVSLTKVGDVAVAEGRLGDARLAFERSLAIMEQTAAQDPGNTGWQRDVTLSLDKVGDVAVAERRLGDARLAFERSLAIREQLVAQDPGNTGWQRDMTVSLDELGDVAVAEGRLGDARLAFERSLAIRQQMGAQQPGNTGWQRDMTVSLDKLGGVAVAVGHLGDARLAFERSLAIRQQMVAQQPGNTGWQRDVAVSLTKVGDIAVGERRLGDARLAFGRSLAIIEQMMAQDPRNAQARMDAAGVHGKLTHWAMQTRDCPMARKHLAGFDGALDDLRAAGIQLRGLAAYHHSAEQMSLALAESCGP
jgi:tetratricopeptide (TPR) repeat protein